MTSRLFYQALSALRTCGLALGMAATLNSPLDAQAGAHAAHPSERPAAAAVEKTPHGAPASDAASALTGWNAEAAMPDCCGGCDAPVCSMAAGCGSSYVAVVGRQAPASSGVRRRASPERRLEAARSLTPRPPTPPPQLVG